MKLLDTLLGAIALLMVASTTALLANRAAAQPLALGAPFRPAVPEGVGQVKVLAGLHLLNGGNAIFVDAREAERYRAGHVRGAVSLPAAALELGPPPAELLARMQRTPFVVLYCDGPECQAALHAVRRLKALGVARLWLMPEGWPAWSAAGYPAAMGDAPEPALLDRRSSP